MQTEYYALRFAGTKADLKIQLDKWCKENRQSFNSTVIELIQKHLKNKQKQNEKHIRQN